MKTSARITDDTKPEGGERRTGVPAARTEMRAAAGYRAVLAVPAFRRLWLAQLFAALGEAVASVAMPLLAYAVTGSAQILSLIFAAQFVPRVVLAPVVGVLVDRLDRRRVMLGADIGRALLVAVLPFTDRAWQIAAVATLVAVGNALARPAESAAVPSVVPADQLVVALSASQVATSVVRVVGPALGAALVGSVGPRPAFGLQALCFIVSAGWLYALVLPPVAHTSVNGSTVAAAVRREIADGLHAVWMNPVVRGIAAVEALWQVVGAVFVVALVVLVEETLDLGDRAGPVYALLMASFSAGAACGALVAGRVERRIGRPRLMAIGYLAPLLLLPAGLTPPLPVLFVCWVTLGFTDAWAVIAMQAYLAESVPDRLRGRVYATWNAAVTLGAAIAFTAVGWLTPRLGAPFTIALAGALVGLGGPGLLLITGAVASMRREIPSGSAGRTE